jgi:hypothetical protein
MAKDEGGGKRGRKEGGDKGGFVSMWVCKNGREADYARSL